MLIKGEYVALDWTGLRRWKAKFQPMARSARELRAKLEPRTKPEIKRERFEEGAR